MIEGRFLALLAVVAWTACSNTESHSGTRVGTETTLEARIVDGQGTPIAASVFLRRSAVLPVSMGGPGPLAEATADNEGQVHFEVARQDELLMLEVWSQDSALAIWMDSLQGDALPSVIELLPTQGVALYLGVNGRDGLGIDSAWIWFPGTNMATTLAVWPPSFVYVPQGTHSLSIRLSNGDGQPIVIHLEGFQVSASETGTNHFYLDLWELRTLESGCILDLLPGNVVPRDNTQNIVCR
jgi:hypothetical protein